MCASREQLFEISTPRYVSIGSSSFPHFHLNSTGFLLSSLQTSTAYMSTFAVTLHFLVYSRTHLICSCSPSAVPATPTTSSADIKPGTISSPTLTPSCADSIASIRWLMLKQSSNKGGENVDPWELPVEYQDIATFPRLASGRFAYSFFFFTILHIFPPVPVSHIFSQNPFLHTVS